MRTFLSLLVFAVSSPLFAAVAIPPTDINPLPTQTVVGRTAGGTGAAAALTTLPNSVQDNITRLGTITTQTTISNTSPVLTLIRNTAVTAGSVIITRQANTTDNNSLQILYESDTTGAGAATNVSFASLEFKAALHDNGTRQGQIIFNTALGGTGFRESARLTANSNWLVGGSIEISGTGGGKFFGTTAATNTTSGAFQIGGGTAATGIGMGGGAIYAGSGYFNVTNARINTATAAYGAGTAYALTATPAAIDLGTTDPSITIPATGTYTIAGSVNLFYNAATFAANQTVTLTFRRTNNTAADLTNGTVLATTQIITALTGTFGVFRMPDITYSGASGDTITIFASVSVAPGAGSVDAIASGTYIRAKLDQ